MPNRRQILAYAAAAPFASLAAPAFAMTPKVYNEGGIAIDGSATVAYFDENGPVRGSPEFAVDWNGATWQFANAENLAKFEANPEAYAPQYGGYCAFAVSKGYTASTVPEAWSIHDGKLYLNFSRTVRARWALNKRANIEAADANWPDVLSA